jgi:hypothetical protein
VATPEVILLTEAASQMGDAGREKYETQFGYRVMLEKT